MGPGDAPKLQRLLSRHPQLLTTPFGNKRDSLLTRAAAADEDSCVQAILAQAWLNRPDDFTDILNHRNADGNTALAQAIRAGALDLAKSLLTYAPIDVNAPNHRGQAPLHLAAMQEEPEFAVRLLNHPAIHANKPDGDGNTLLHLVVMQGHSKTAVKIAGHAKTAPDEVNRDGKSPLAMAIASKDLLVVDTLLKKPGVNPDRTNSQGQTLLWQEVTHWDDNRVLGGPDSGSSTWSVILGLLAASLRVDANLRGPEGETPLTYLSKLSCPWDIAVPDEFNQWRNGAVKAMLDASRRGADRLDPDAPNDKGETPRQVALATGNTSLLGTFDADAEARRRRGRSNARRCLLG